MATAFVTGAGGCLGNAVAEKFLRDGWHVVAFDGRWPGRPENSDSCVQRLRDEYGDSIKAIPTDLLHPRDSGGIRFHAAQQKPAAIIHCAGQSSTEFAGLFPLVDCKNSTQTTIDLLEVVRVHTPASIFVYISSSDVYGEHVSQLSMEEAETRYWPLSKVYADGVMEGSRVDQVMRGPLGTFRLCADLMCQEYGKYYGIKTGVFRCGEVINPKTCSLDSGNQICNMIRAGVTSIPYMIEGYEGKRTKDILHAEDAAEAVWHYVQRPGCGEVLNLGGGKGNAVSTIELLHEVMSATGTQTPTTYQPTPPKAASVWYVTNNYKMTRTYPTWGVTKSVPQIVGEVWENVRKSTRFRGGGTNDEGADKTA